MDDPNQGPAAQTDGSSENSGGADLTVDLTTSPVGGSPTGEPPSGASVTNEEPPRAVLQPYTPERQRDYVRLIVTVGLLLMLGWVIVWSCIEAASWPDHWAQTKEMLQAILPALTGLIGSVIGFYFGSGVNAKSTNSSTTSSAADKIV